jgi:hypothetical protein
LKSPLRLGVAAISCAAFFLSAAPAAADHEHCRRDITSYMLQCGFGTLAQCQEMSFGRGADCFRNPSLDSAADAYAYAPGVSKTYTPTHHIARNSVGARSRIKTKFSGSLSNARQPKL